jgi:hypothetical protein
MSKNPKRDRVDERVDELEEELEDMRDRISNLLGDEDQGEEVRLSCRRDRR